MSEILRIFNIVLLVAVAAMLLLFLRSNFRQWRRSKDFAGAIEQPKFDYLKRELGERQPDE